MTCGRPSRSLRCAGVFQGAGKLPMYLSDAANQGTSCCGAYMGTYDIAMVAQHPNVWGQSYGHVTRGTGSADQVDQLTAQLGIVGERADRLMWEKNFVCMNLATCMDGPTFRLAYP